MTLSSIKRSNNTSPDTELCRKYDGNDGNDEDDVHGHDGVDIELICAMYIQ